MFKKSKTNDCTRRKRNYTLVSGLERPTRQVTTLELIAVLKENEGDSVFFVGTAHEYVMET